MANVYQTCMFMTAELTKESLKPGIRPRSGSIMGTQSVAYDADCNLGIYDDLKDRGDAADLVWHDPREVVLTASEEGTPMLAPRRKPVLEVVVDKNKITDYDGCIYYEFDMVSAQLKECSENEQAIFREKAADLFQKSAASEIGKMAPSAEHPSRQDRHVSSLTSQPGFIPAPARKLRMVKPPEQQVLNRLGIHRITS